EIRSGSKGHQFPRGGTDAICRDLVVWKRLSGRRIHDRLQAAKIALLQRLRGHRYNVRAGRRKTKPFIAYEEKSAVLDNRTPERTSEFIPVELWFRKTGSKEIFGRE